METEYSKKEGRPYIELVPKGESSIESGSAQWSIMQWNILADCYSDSFPKADPEHLTFPYRLSLIKQELEITKPSILCLEVVDKYTEILSLIQTTLGWASYSSIFKKKPHSSDGLAMIYDTSLFQLLKSVNGNYEHSNQVYIISLFKQKEDGSIFIVFCTHLKAKKGFELKRKEQAILILCFLKQFVRENELGEDVPVLICGDFNDEPESEAYKVIMGSEFGLRSCYDLEGKGEPEFTTLKIRESLVKHTIDYIFCTKKHFKVWKILGIPDEEEVGINGWPSKKYPSDHVSLLVHLSLEE
jgi:mRNA deadenylase 3'-5' endonuclease subunit Ccr4